MTPLQAIRNKCLDCCLGNQDETMKCSAKGCSLHEYRSGHRAELIESILLRAIRYKCLDCSGFNPYEVSNCNRADCPLHQFRNGHDHMRTSSRRQCEQVKLWDKAGSISND